MKFSFASYGWKCNFKVNKVPLRQDVNKLQGFF